MFYTAPTAIRSLIKAAEANEKAHPEELRPDEPAHPRLGRRADQSGRLGVVPPAHRRRPLPDRRHLLADRDRRPHDHAAARRHAAGARLLHAAVPRHRRGDRRRDRRRRAERQGRHPGRQEALAEHDPHDLGRPRALQEQLLPGRNFQGKYYLAGDGAIRDEKTGYFTHHRPHRRRAQRQSGHRMGTMEIESALVAMHRRWSPRPPSSAGPTRRPARRSAPSSC